ncbi:MAG: VTT domain-containing protein [Firmicutes bacterium]|nr:VTT domain-containing protein [Bacillota bacterium]
MEILDWLQSNDQGLFLFILSFANAVFFPIGPEVAFFPILIVNQSKLVPYALYCVTGSVLGLMVTYFIAFYFGQSVIEKYVPLSKIEKGESLFSRYGPYALVVASMFPIFPYRILVILSGFLRQKPSVVLCFLTVGKLLRFFGYGFLVAKLGESMIRYIF